MLSSLASQLRNKILKKNNFSFVTKYNFNSLLFTTQKKNFSSVYVNHRDTIDNNQDSPFDFTEENYKKVEEIMVYIIKNKKKSNQINNYN